MMTAEVDRITLEKVEQRCVFCGSNEQLRDFSRKVVCAPCVEKLTATSA
jgi:hypothetical protein